MKAITTRYLGPTNYRGSRIVASDEDGHRAFVSYLCERSLDQNHDAAAISLCKKMAWYGTLVRGRIEHGNVYVFVEDDNQLRILP